MYSFWAIFFSRKTGCCVGVKHLCYGLFFNKSEERKFQMHLTHTLQTNTWKLQCYFSLLFGSILKRIFIKKNLFHSNIFVVVVIFSHGTIEAKHLMNNIWKFTHKQKSVQFKFVLCIHEIVNFSTQKNWSNKNSPKVFCF